jgi:hypothetical protein
MGTSPDFATPTTEGNHTGKNLLLLGLSFLYRSHQRRSLASFRLQKFIAFLANPAALSFHGSGARCHPCFHGEQSSGP